MTDRDHTQSAIGEARVRITAALTWVEHYRSGEVAPGLALDAIAALLEQTATWLGDA